MPRAFSPIVALVASFSCAIGTIGAGCSDVGDIGGPDSDEPVVTSETTAVVITETNVLVADADADCERTGLVYSLDLSAKTLAYTICPNGHQESGAFALTTADIASIDTPLTQMRKVGSDVGGSGPSGPTLSFAITTNGQTITYYDESEANVTGIIDTLSGGAAVDIAVSGVVAAHVPGQRDAGLDASSSPDAG